MKVYAWVLLEECADQRGLMGREVVENDVDLLMGRAQRDDFMEKSDKVEAGMTRGCLPWTRPVAVSSAAYRESVPCR